MDTFTASNGVLITIRTQKSDGAKYLLGIGLGEREWTDATASAHGVEALREFFRAEEDERLSRWRWPMNPTFLVYPMPGKRQVSVVREDTGDALPCLSEESLFGTKGGSLYRAAACAYFETHPETFPWDEAVSGEVWAVTPHGEPEVAATVKVDMFPRFISVVDGLSYGPKAIAAARRIWPQVSDA